MKLMRYCLCVLAIAAAASLAAATPPAGGTSETLNGTLSVHQDGPATLATPDHKTITLAGDDTTIKVLADPRVNGFNVQVKGHFTSSDKFQIDPSFQHSMLVHKDGKLKLISYYCEVCNIRDYTPGPCRCCQRETTLQLIDPDAGISQ